MFSFSSTLFKGYNDPSFKVNSMNETVALLYKNSILVLKTLTMNALFTMSLCTFLACVPLFPQAQELAIIDKNDRTAPVFDEGNPMGLMGLLHANRELWGHYELEGMADSLVEALTPQEKSECLRFIPRFLDIEYDEFGEQKVRFNPDLGYDDYVYIAPDTVFTNISGIERIVIRMEQGDFQDTLTTLECWKSYNGNLVKVLSMQTDVLHMEGFTLFETVDDATQRALLDKKDASSLWNRLKKEGHDEYQYIREGFFEDERVFLDFHFFPHFNPTQSEFFGKQEPKRLYENYIAERNVLTLTNDKSAAELPFKTSFGEALFQDTNNRVTVEREFNEVVRFAFLSDVPKLDLDPASIYFGTELMVTLPDGSMEYIYEDPIIVYFWVDFEPVQLYLGRQLIENEETGVVRLEPAKLYLAKVMPDGTNELVTTVLVDEKLLPFFSEYPQPTLRELEWHQLLQSEIANPKNRFDLTNPKDIKRLNKRNKKRVQ